jgi:hypothetical protein
LFVIITLPFCIAGKVQAETQGLQYLEVRHRRRRQERKPRRGSQEKEQKDPSGRQRRGLGRKELALSTTLRGRGQDSKGAWVWQDGILPERGKLTK